MCRACFIALTAVLVTILVPLCSSRPQHKCRSSGETCVQYNECGNIIEKVRSRNFESCGIENYILFVCCKNVIKADPTPLAPAPVPPPPRTPFRSSKNATAVALENCKKYEHYTYVVHWKEPDLPGRSKIAIRKKNCVFASSLIVKGDPALPKEYPHMALIGYGNTFEDIEWACGGSLISEKFILSAAHCGKSTLGSPRWAKLGDLDISSNVDDANPAVYSIVKVHNHPLYNSRFLINDISLFELNTVVAMSAYVRPACLSTLNSHPVGTKGRITGWGVTGTIERSSDQLLKATIYTVEDWRCKNKFEQDGYNSSTMICAGDLNTGKDTCWGDSGGPLQSMGVAPCMWDIFGVTSYGAGICGNKEDPSVFTNVAFFLDWIQSIVWP